MEPGSPALQAASLSAEPPGGPLPAARLQEFFSALRFLGADQLMVKGRNCWLCGILCLLMWQGIFLSLRHGAKSWI